LANPFKIAGDQVVGSAVDFFNNKRISELNEELAKVLTKENTAISQQDQRFLVALSQVENIHDFLKTPEKILGSNLTKHGEIAEQIEVNIRNARNLIDGHQPNASFEGIGRTAPADYLIGGNEVQSKFINGINNNLDHIREHMHKYSNFGRNTSFYHIPKDTYETIQRILQGNPPLDLNSRTTNKILEKVAKIEKESGKSFSDVVKPSLSNYSEVQRGSVNDTLKKHEEELTVRNNEKKDEIHKQTDKEREQVQQDGKPNLQEGLKAGVIGITVGGSINIALFIYKKHKEGKSIFQFNNDDWKDLGINFAKGGAKGGISGFSIYSLTNFTDMSAPMASAFVSASFGIVKLAADFKQGKIGLDELVAHGQIVCLESGMVALGASIGQTLIPIPIVGTLIGSFSISTLISLTKKYLKDHEQEISAKLNQIYNEALKNIQIEYRKIVEEIIEEYNRLGTITQMAFNFECNAICRFKQSKQLAISYQIKEENILKDIDQINNYFLN